MTRAMRRQLGVDFLTILGGLTLAATTAGIGFIAAVELGRHARNHAARRSMP